MGGYTPLRPWTNGAAPGVSAGFLTALEAVLSRPSGDTETGKYILANSIYANGALASCYIPTLSRSATPVSVTLDEADLSHAGGFNGGPATNFLSSSGFQAYTLNTTGPNVNGRCGGNYTVTY